MAYPGNYRQPQPVGSQFRQPARQQAPPGGYAPYGAPPGGYAPYGAPAMGRGAPGGPAMGRGGPAMGRGGPVMGRGVPAMGRGYPPQAGRGYPPQGAPGRGYPAPQYPPNANFRPPPITGRPVGVPPQAAVGRGAARGPGPGGYPPAQGGRGAPMGAPGGPMYYGRPGGPALGGGPAMLKRQASLLRSAYPNSRFCRVFLNTGGASGSASGGSAVNVPPNLTQEVPRCPINYTFDYEQTVLSEAISARRAEQASSAEVETRVHRQASESQDGRMRKIASLAGITGRSQEECRSMLEAAGWDLNRASSLAYASTDNVMEGAALGEGSGGGDRTAITLVFPDQTRLIFSMAGSDTFWQLYGRVVEGKPEYASKSFNFRLGNNRVMAESNFDESFEQNYLTPSAQVWVVNA